MPSNSTADIRLINQTFLDQLANPSMAKSAADAANDFTRLKLREDGIYRKIMPPLEIGNDELDRSANSDKPMKLVEREVDSPAAVSLPFNSLPTNINIRGHRYPVFFERISSPRFYKDVNELRTYDMDIRQVLSDNAIKDMLAQEDGTFLRAVNTILGSINTTVTFTGATQWVGFSGGLSRINWMESKKILPRTFAHLETHTVLMNNVTVKEIQKWDRLEAGGDLSQQLLHKGFNLTELDNTQIVVTIKRDLVPDDTIFHFADPKFIGKSYILDDVTMYIERKAGMLEYYAYETVGGAIGNAAGVARADFA
jgi:hypothetical protein